MSLILLFSPLFAMAEYGGHHVEFNLFLRSGEVIHAYQYIPTYFNKPDSISYKEYFEEYREILLNDKFYDDFSLASYYQKRIKYTWEYEEGEENFIFTLIEKQSIDTAAVASISVIEIIPYSYLMGVASSHDWSDREWMAEKPKKVHQFGGYFCDYQVFFHEWNEDIASLVTEINSEMARAETIISKLKEDLRYVDGNEYDEIEEEIDRWTESLDEKIDELLAPIYDYKVVVINTCTC
ncbi:MAG: hypothetical protein WBG42_05080 [Cryomorphaceae bacterium]